MLQKVLDILNNVPPGTYEALLASGIISPLLVGVKKWFSVQSERVMITLVVVLGMLAAAGNYLLHVPTQDPSIIALQGAVIAFMTQPVYFFFVKPLFGKISSTLEAAAKFNDEVKSAAEPAGGVPLSGIALPGQYPVPPQSVTSPLNGDDFSQ
jgi:hypothetical protein